jgi:hypothetical protein
MTSCIEISITGHKWGQWKQTAMESAARKELILAFLPATAKSE